MNDLEMEDLELSLVLKALLKEVKKEDSPDMWDGAKYELQRKIQIDKRGSVGERFFSQTLNLLYPRRVTYKDGDQGDWDLSIGKMKFEIKTATLGKNKKFQNEGLKKHGDYNGVLFLGIAPDDIYMYCIKVSNINFENKRIDHNGVHVNLHDRGNDESTTARATGSGFKCDLKPQQMTKIETLGDLKRVFDAEFGDKIK